MVVPEHVTLSCQGLITLPTAEVTRVPVLRHRLRVFSAENQLITGCTARLQLLGIVSLTVQEVIVNTVREVHQKLLTHAAHEA